MKNVNQDKIYDIEKKVAELKFLERDLIKERDIARLKSLDEAEKSDAVEDVVRSFFPAPQGAERKDLMINSFPSKFSGRDEDEFMSEVRVEIRFKPAAQSHDYNEIALFVYLNNGFQIEDVRRIEKDIMDKLLEIRKNVNELKESKKFLKQSI
jgi:Ran GTPase-activating protein (RanGAP) involved in mRNA processing and transport